ncbi:hypothetical protein [Clostridium sp. B9]|uniref:hypothetical protein n=1 Tax=Clostridium sp. B9 TaxID=3423224 RepID=UPI003D2F2F6B
MGDDIKIKKGEYDDMFTKELKDLLAGLYQKYGCTQEVLTLSKIIDKIVVEEQSQMFEKYKMKNKRV